MDIDDIYFEFTLKDEKISGYKLLDGNKLRFTGVRAPSLTREQPTCMGKSCQPAYRKHGSLDYS
jgi:hypothetical protein